MLGKLILFVFINFTVAEVNVTLVSNTNDTADKSGVNVRLDNNIVASNLNISASGSSGSFPISTPINSISGSTGGSTDVSTGVSTGGSPGASTGGSGSDFGGFMGSFSVMFKNGISTFGSIAGKAQASAQSAFQSAFDKMNRDIGAMKEKMGGLLIGLTSLIDLLLKCTSEQVSGLLTQIVVQIRNLLKLSAELVANLLNVLDTLLKTLTDTVNEANGDIKAKVDGLIANILDIVNQLRRESAKNVKTLEDQLNKLPIDGTENAKKLRATLLIELEKARQNEQAQLGSARDKVLKASNELRGKEKSDKPGGGAELQASLKALKDLDRELEAEIKKGAVKDAQNNTVTKAETGANGLLKDVKSESSTVTPIGVSPHK